MIGGEDYLMQFNIQNSNGVNYDLSILTDIKAKLINKKNGNVTQNYRWQQQEGDLPIYKDGYYLRLYITKELLKDRVNGVWILELDLHVENSEVAGGIQIIKEIVKLEKLRTNEL